jgi:hypothetical protein
MPNKHGLDAHRNDRRRTAAERKKHSASRAQTFWRALNGTFVATVIGVGASVIPPYLSSNSGTTTASGSTSASVAPATSADDPLVGFPRSAAFPPPGDLQRPGATSLQGSDLASRPHALCQRAAYRQHLASLRATTSPQQPSSPRPSPVLAHHDCCLSREHFEDSQGTTSRRPPALVIVEGKGPSLGVDGTSSV